MSSTHVPDCVSSLPSWCLPACTDRKSPCCRWTTRRSQAGAFSHPFRARPSQKCLSQSNPVTKCPYKVPLPWCSNPDSWAFRLQRFQQGWSVLHLDLGAGGCCIMSQDHAITFRLPFFPPKKTPDKPRHPKRWFCLVKVLMKICMPPPHPQHHVQRALLLDVVVRQHPAIVELLFSKERTLLVRRDASPGSWFSRCRSCRTLTCYSESMRAIAAANHRANSWMTHHLDSNCFPLLQQHNIPTCSANAKSHNHQY